MAKKRKSTAVTKPKPVAQAQDDDTNLHHDITPNDTFKHEPKASEWTVDHPMVGSKFRTIVPFWLLPPSSQIRSSDVDSTLCFAVIIAHLSEDKVNRRPELFRVFYAIEKECSCSRKVKDNVRLGLEFPDGPLRASCCVRCGDNDGGEDKNEMKSSHTLYVSADVTRSEIPQNSKARKTTMMNTDSVSDSLAKRSRYMDAVNRTTTEHYNGIIMPHLTDILMESMKELEWEYLCINGSLDNYSGAQCYQLLERIRNAIELCRLANSIENVVTYKVAGSRVSGILNKIFLSGESMFSLSATHALLDALSSIDKYLLCEVLIELVKDGAANCDRVFDTVVEMCNKSRFRTLITPRKVSGNVCSTFWEQFCPPVPTPTEADINQDAQLALMLEKEEENSQDDTVVKRSVRASNRSKSSAIYYGSYNTNLSSKEAIEVVHRLITQSTDLVTVETLQALLLSGDVPSDVDIRKIRSILGYLLCGNRTKRIWCTVSPFKKDLAGSSKLISYLIELQKVEHLLRTMVVGILQKKCIEQGLSDCMDNDATQDQFDESSDTTWTKNHPFVGSKILRGSIEYDVTSYSPSIPLIDDEDSLDLLSKCNIKGKPVLRRGRLKCVESQNTLYLTESQVFAGVEAYKVQNELVSMSRYPELSNYGAELVNRLGFKLVLSVDAVYDEIENNGFTCTVAGIGSEPGRLLLLFHTDSSKPGYLMKYNDSVWGTLSESSSKITLDGMSSKLSVFWHGVSQSADEAMDLLSAVKFHQKAAPFLEPVDPVSMNLHDYYKVIKNPMDLLTIEKKLAAGKYFHGLSNDIDVMKFRRDFNLIWDNAMSYNLDGSWIHSYAMTMKKFTNRKIENAFKKNRADTYASSIYYEPDYSDDEFDRKSRRSRSNTQQPLINPGSAIERSIKLSVIEETLPIQKTISLFTLPEEWSVRKRAMIMRPSTANFVSARLSRRATSQQQKKTETPLASVAYYTSSETACDRSEIEAVREKLHENFASEYQDALKASSDGNVSLSESERLFPSNTFPPYLGRVANGKWEIPQSKISSAIRWVARGLIHSKHLIETEDVLINTPGSGAVMLANCYWKSAPPFDILDDGKKAVPKRKGKDDEALEKQKEKEAQEMSEYEKMRAERVARNQERLKMLGLG